MKPADAVVSISLPASVELEEVRGAMCNRTNFYRSAEVAPKWTTEHPDGRLLSVADTFEAWRRAALRIWGDQLSG